MPLSVNKYIGLKESSGMLKRARHFFLGKCLLFDRKEVFWHFFPFVINLIILQCILIGLNYVNCLVKLNTHIIWYSGKKHCPTYKTSLLHLPHIWGKYNIVQQKRGTFVLNLYYVSFLFCVLSSIQLKLSPTCTF